MLRESYENGLVVHEFATLLLVYLKYITIYKYCLIVWLLSEKRKESMCCFLVLFPIRYSSTALVSCLQLRKSLIALGVYRVLHQPWRTLRLTLK